MPTEDEGRFSPFPPEGGSFKVKPEPAEKDGLDYGKFIRRIILAAISYWALGQEHASIRGAPPTPPPPTTPVTVRIRSPGIHSPRPSPLLAEPFQISSLSKSNREPGSVPIEKQPEDASNLLSTPTETAPIMITTVYSRDVGAGRGEIQESFQPYSTFSIGNERFTIGLSPGLGLVRVRVIDDRNQQLLEQPERLGVILGHGDGIMLLPDHKLFMWRLAGDRILGDWFAWDKNHHVFRWISRNYSDRIQQSVISQRLAVETFSRPTQYQRELKVAQTLIRALNARNWDRVKELVDDEEYRFLEWYLDNHPDLPSQTLDSRDSEVGGGGWTFTTHGPPAGLRLGIYVYRERVRSIGFR